MQQSENISYDIIFLSNILITGLHKSVNPNIYLAYNMEPSDMIEVTDIIKKTEETLDNLWKKFELFCPKCLHFKVNKKYYNIF